MSEILQQWWDSIWSKFWEYSRDLLLALLEALPVPDWAAEAPQALQYLAEHAGYAVYVCALDRGIEIFASAMLIRFVIRRIPGIG